MRPERDVDVLVVGSGAAGLTAALSARENGAQNVLIAESEGLAGGSSRLTAGAVVVATGGFGNNPEKLARYFPSAAGTGWAWYIGAEGSRGDHLDLAVQVGAQVTGYDHHGLRLLHAGFASIYEAYLPGWLVLVDRQGRRSCDETAPYGIMDGLIQTQGDVAYVIFDRATLDDATAAGVARYKQKVSGSTKKQSPHWNTDIVESMVAAGKVHQAPSVAELAAGFGLPAGHLEATVERYNAAAAAGEDFDYLKDPKFLEPITTPPFCAAEIRPATVYFTACGLRIDRDAQVISETGRPIPGLFAAGESAGGVVGPRYVGSGNSYANCVTFGRVAGASAARLAMARP